jgi:hypothetical protein
MAMDKIWTYINQIINAGGFPSGNNGSNTTLKSIGIYERVVYNKSTRKFCRRADDNQTAFPQAIVQT